MYKYGTIAFSSIGGVVTGLISMAQNGDSAEAMLVGGLVALTLGLFFYAAHTFSEDV